MSVTRIFLPTTERGPWAQNRGEVETIKPTNEGKEKFLRTLQTPTYFGTTFANFRRSATDTMVLLGRFLYFHPEVTQASSSKFGSRDKSTACANIAKGQPQVAAIVARFRFFSNRRSLKILLNLHEPVGSAGAEADHCGGEAIGARFALTVLTGLDKVRHSKPVAWCQLRASLNRITLGPFLRDQVPKKEISMQILAPDTKFRATARTATVECGESTVTNTLKNLEPEARNTVRVNDRPYELREHILAPRW